MYKRQSENSLAAADAHAKVSSKAWAILGAMGLGAFIAQMLSLIHISEPTRPY